MTSPYIEERNGGYYIAGTRVSLDSVVYAFERGNSPEAIQKEFPLLRLPQVYGAIALYLDNRIEMRQYLEKEERRIQESSVALSEANPELWSRLQQARDSERPIFFRMAANLALSKVMRGRPTSPLPGGRGSERGGGSKRNRVPRSEPRAQASGPCYVASHACIALTFIPFGGPPRPMGRSLALAALPEVLGAQMFLHGAGSDKSRTICRGPATLPALPLQPEYD